MADMLYRRSGQCINFDFNLADLSESLSLEEVAGVKCEILETEPLGAMVPTGATLDEIDDNACNGDLPSSEILLIGLPSWAILLIVLSVLGFCGGIIFWLKRNADKRKQSKSVFNNSQTVKVQMGRQSQYTVPAHVQPQYNVQAKPMNVQVVQAIPIPEYTATPYVT